MCIRDRPCRIVNFAGGRIDAAIEGGEMCPAVVNTAAVAVVDVCLLYTSDSIDANKQPHTEVRDCYVKSSERIFAI